MQAEPLSCFLFCIIPVFTLWERFHVCLECSSSLIPRTVPGWGKTASMELRGRQEGHKGFPKASRSRKTRRLNPMNKERYKTRKEIADIFGGGSKNGFLLDAGRMPGFLYG